MRLGYLTPHALHATSENGVQKVYFPRARSGVGNKGRENSPNNCAENKSFLHTFGCFRCRINKLQNIAGPVIIPARRRKAQVVLHVANAGAGIIGRRGDGQKRPAYVPKCRKKRWGGGGVDEA